jgi:hypothetical protein
MRSDDRTQLALVALDAPRARFRTAVAVARDQMAAWLAAHRVPSGGGVPSIAQELGRFANGRIDGSRFAGIFSAGTELADGTTERIEQAIDVLDALLARGDDLFVCNVPSGGDLRDTVDAALGEAGRAFGAVLAFQAAKTKGFRADHHAGLMKRFPFGRWNRAERLLAPPLVVEVDGGDLRGEQLADFLDGHVRLVVVVRGASAPAPLARLITPGLFVMQANDVSELTLVAEADAPAIAALVPEGAARFVHTPDGGASVRERLCITHLPTQAPTHALGPRSAAQQREELALLTELSRWPETAAAAGSLETGAAAQGAAAAVAATLPAAPAGVSPVDALASWLLGAAGFTAGAAPADGARS